MFDTRADNGTGSGTAMVDDPGGLPLSLKTLRSAVALASEGSTARAAAIINTSPTSITRSIQILEARLGVPLFGRHARGMVATAAGSIIVARASRAFGHLELGAREAVAAGGHGEAPHDARLSRLARLVSERLLFVLVAVAETGSLTQAAERLRLSQPAVSQAIRDLEHLAGASLVERTSRGVRLTEAGEILLLRVRHMLMELRVAEEEVASMRGTLHGRVVIASLPYSSVDLVPEAVTRFLAQHPQIMVTVIDGTYDTLIDRLRNADIDFIVGTLRPAAFDDIEQEALFDDTLSVACRAGHPCTRTAPLALRDVAAGPWVVPLPNTVTRASFEAAFQSEDIGLPPARLEMHNPMAVRSILLASDYLALLSPHQIRAETASGQLAVLPIVLRGTQRTIGLTSRRDASPSPGVEALRQALRAAARAFGTDPAANR
jgi:LysR family transcriptional regulator of gallate degradation